MSEFNYKGVTAVTDWKNGNWYTTFSINGEPVKTIERVGSFDEDDTKAIIRNQILRFI